MCTAGQLGALGLNNKVRNSPAPDFSIEIHDLHRYSIFPISHNYYVFRICLCIQHKRHGVDKMRNNDGRKMDRLPAMHSQADNQGAGRESVPGEFPVVVGIGASAGGLETLKEFFSAMPPISDNFCFVVIMHLPPDRMTMLPEILAYHTRLKVMKADEGMSLLPNTVYCLPADNELFIRDGRFLLREPAIPGRVSHVIDRFFRSLAMEQAERAIAVIFSGAGNDGAQGVKEIKKHGGIVIVQVPETAIYPDMPQSAVATGMTDIVLPVAAMPEKIIEIIGRLSPTASGKEQLAGFEEQLATILQLVKKKTGHDFKSYKTETVLRRLQRRMTVNDIHDLTGYAALLIKTPQEADALYKDILIGVTSFFRDPGAFAAIQKKIIPRLFANRDPDDTVRIWHPCCATGEEVYTMAILLREYIKEHNLNTNVQFFATDLDDGSVAAARAGVFPPTIADNISKERLDTWFTRAGSNYQVEKSLREMIVFAHHNLIKDPPFSRLDLLVCRNFLIYLNQEMQQKLINLFHQVLKPDGFLFLGCSESVGRQTEQFAPVDNKWKIFQRQGTIRKRDLTFPLVPAVSGLPSLSRPFTPHRVEEPSATAAVEKLLMERFLPPCAVVSEKYEGVYFSNLTNRFLVYQIGEPTRDILQLVREELRPALRTAIHKCLTDQQRVEFGRIKVTADGDTALVTIKVEPVRIASAPKLAMVVFEQASQPPPSEPVEACKEPLGSDSMKDALICQLEEQLRISHNQLQGTVEQLEASNEAFMSVNEELTSTNEELQSTNEELQSTNEELETSKEELQTLNEELVTVNAELQEKVEELNQANSDMENLFNSSELATIFLDGELTIKRYSPAMAAILKIIPADVGRPLGHFAGILNWSGLARDARQVSDTLAPVEREVSDIKGEKHYLMRVLPYRTTEGEAKGIVVTLVDITERTLAEVETRHLASFPRLNPNPILEVDSSGRVVFYNPAMHNVLEDLKMTDADVGAFLPPDLEVILNNLNNGTESSIYREVSIKDREFGTFLHLVPQFGVLRIYAYDTTEQKRAEERLDLLAEIAGDLLRAVTPRQVVKEVCRKVMVFLDCDAFFNYLVVPQTGRLHLNSYAGIPDEAAHRIEWLDYGMAVSGCVARDGFPIVTENIGELSDARTELVKSYGIQAYVCHPMTMQSGVMGTLSFGSRTRTSFTDDDLSLMKAVTDQVTIAMERMRSDDAIRESELRYRGLFDHMLEGLAYCRMLFEDGEPQDFVYIAANEAFETLTGLKDVIGKRVTDVIPGIKESDTELFEIYGSVAMGGEPRRFEMFVEALGMWFDISVYCPEKEYFVAVFDVITERKQAEESLREREKHYRILFNAITDAVFVHDVTPNGSPGRFLEVNNVACERLGYSRQELLGMSPVDLDARESRLDFEEIGRRVLAGEKVTFEQTHVARDGRHIAVEITANLFMLGSQPAVLSLARDITDRKLAEAEREKTDRLESLGVLAGGIAHDFNNILTAVIGNISLARHQVGAENAATPQLAACEKALEKATKLSRQLLTFARGGEPVKEVVDTEQLIHEVVSFTLHGSNCKAELNLEPGLRHLYGDTGQIHQALNNLIINAVQAMPQGGIISINAGNAAVGAADGRKLPEGDYVRIEVSDQGSGIPPEIIGKIFDPYFTTKPTGSGIGLASVFSIANRHGGTVEVSTTLGKGTVFTLWLPAADARHGGDKAAAEHDLPGLSTAPGASILVMDDEEMIRGLARKMLAYLGYEAVVCADGVEAVTLYRERWAQGKPFAAVILDMTIPGGMGGLEAAWQIVEIDPDAILIISSGYSSESALTGEKDSPYRGTVTKPYNVQQLSEALSQVLQHVPNAPQAFPK
jgi:PAS domain S-box-containing protein